MRAALTTSEQSRLDELCGVVRKGMETFVDVAAALMSIRDEGLYRARCSTFEAFVQIEFGMSRSFAYRQIAAAETVKLLSGTPDTAEMSPIGDTAGGANAPLPESESVARPLTTLPADQQREAWAEANELAKAEGKPKATAQHTRIAAEARKAPRPAREKPEDAAAAIVASTKKTEPEERSALAPKRRPNITHLMNVIDAATGLTNESTDDEIRAIAFNDLMGARLRAARDFIDRVLAVHTKKGQTA